MRSRLTSAAAIAIACAALFGTSACGSTSPDSESESARFTPLETTAAEANTKASAPTERSSDEFKVQSAGNPAYSIEFAGNDTRCVVYPNNGSNGYFDCEVSLGGTMPPVDLDPAPDLYDGVDIIMYEDGTGFVTTYDVGGGEGTPKTGTLAAGEQVQVADFTFTAGTDGTARVERDGHWFEVDNRGQYSSDRFDPANAAPASAQSKPAADPTTAAKQELSLNDAQKYSDMIAPGDSFCTTFPYNGGVYVVSATNPGDCSAAGVLQEFVSIPITTPGQTNQTLTAGGQEWRCGYAGSGAGYCEAADGSSVIGRGGPAR